MYCRKCHTLVPDEELICKNCGFDNSTQEDILEETKEIVLNPKVVKAKEDKRKVKKISLLIIVLFIITGVCFYIINDSKHDETTKIETNQDDSINYDKEFHFNNLKMNYPSSLFGASKNTIFYKNNNAFNIEIEAISLDEYNNLEINFVNSSKIGSIDTKTTAADNNYKHIFTDNTNYYLLTVNYLENDTLESIKIQLELSKIINSLTF